LRYSSASRTAETSAFISSLPGEGMTQGNSKQDGLRLVGGRQIFQRFYT